MTYCTKRCAYSRQFAGNEGKKKQSGQTLLCIAYFGLFILHLCLEDGASDTDYTWCNILYGDMILNPEKVKAHISELVDALEYLAEDYDHPNGFALINVLNNQLQAE